MLHTLARRALIAGAALSFAAGCSGNSISPSQNSAVNPSSVHVPAGMRVLPGPVVAGPLIVPLVPRKPNAPAGWPVPRHHHRKKELLFVADAASGVLIYNPKKANSAPTGSITNGVNIPSQVAVDAHGTLYVTNDGNNTVTVYPKGHSSPSLTISSGLNGPYGIGVDSKGNVFVSNIGNFSDYTVTAYAAGQTSPFETIAFSSFGQPVGIGVDASDNVWVACDSSNAVFEIPAGTSKVKNANLQSLDGPISVAFGKNDIIYVSNFAAEKVNIYNYGSTSVSGTITNGIEKYGPTLGGFTAIGSYFQTNQSDDVVGYLNGQTSPFSTLQGATTPLGIASSPLVKK